MKSTISGVTYDTLNSQKICDIGDWSRTLYKTNKDVYFYVAFSKTGYSDDKFYVIGDEETLKKWLKSDSPQTYMKLYGNA